MQNEIKKCQNCKQNFVIEPEDFNFYEKIKVPPPTFCPDCRLIRRLTWRNEKSLYKNKCKKCGNSIISVYSEDSEMTVYCRPCWWGDEWDASEYGIDFDDSKSFLDQLFTLLHKSPMPNLFGLYATLLNSEYTNMVGNLKNCYMITHSDYNENCLYGSHINYAKDSVDNTMLWESELCYENVNCLKCYESFYSVDCESCHNIYFCKNCVGCSDCYGSVNLRNQKYHIFNKAYSKEDYFKKLKQFNLNSYKNIQETKNEILDFWNKFPQKYMHESHNHSVSGDYIYNSKNTHDSFIVSDMENSRYCMLVTPGSGTRDCYDFTHYGTSAELLYETFQSGNQSSNIKFCWYVIINVSDLEYCIGLTGCKNCFGCVSLKKKEYCILNKQYTKEEYFKLREKIISHMNSMPYVDSKGRIYKYGEFFPTEFSPFGYNVTTAQEFFPLTRKEIAEKGYRWKEQEEKDYKIDILPKDLPDTIDSIGEEILTKVIGCEHEKKCNENCMTAFKVITEEFKFYKRMNLPLPRLCSNCRHYQRNKFRNSPKLWQRTCMCNKEEHFHGAGKCEVEFKTTYAPERPEIIYCERCYQQEVY